MALTVTDWLTELGGVAQRGTLVRLVGRAELDRAVEAGLVVRDGRGRYALPGTDAAVRVAATLGGVVSHTDAAIHHGWGVVARSALPHVTVSRGRRLGSRGRLATVHRAELEPHAVEDGFTSHAVTLRDCLTFLPFPEALAVADSALRESGCHQLLGRIADEARGPGSRQVRRVAALATEKAANPFESVVRAICLDVPELAVEPQVVISADGVSLRADLVDELLRIVVEADSYEFHGGRDALAADCRRYNWLVVQGWIVLRFPYEDVMFRPETVRETLAAAVALAELLNERAWSGRSSA